MNIHYNKIVQKLSRIKQSLNISRRSLTYEKNLKIISLLVVPELFPVCTFWHRTLSLGGLLYEKLIFHQIVILPGVQQGSYVWMG
jgi:hypothetical protein